MITLNPTIVVVELLIQKNGREVRRLEFHSGVNILSGHNSSGKTTILDFLAYSMGAENIPWKQEALACDSVLVEVRLNGKSVTLRRDVNQKNQNPMYIYWGELDAALLAPFSDWEVFPFKRSVHKISFTQALLLALDLTEAQGDGASNLTMHQFLRVIYADQPSLHSPIFRADTFDNSLMRETVGNYLCGIYDDRLYSAQIEWRSLEKDLVSLNAELRSIYALFSKSQQDISMLFFSEQIASLSSEREQLEVELARLKTERTIVGAAVEREDTRLRRELNRVKLRLESERAQLVELELEIADTSKFIEEINSRLLSIDDSYVAREHLGLVNFSFCPCCLAEISKSTSDISSCSLCKSPLTDSNNSSQLLRMKNELRIQGHESKNIVAECEVQARAIRVRIPALENELRDLESSYRSVASTWSSEVEEAIEVAARKIGELNQKISNLFEMQKLASVLEGLKQRRDDINHRLVELTSIVEKLEFAQDDRIRYIRHEIVSTLKRLLMRDMDRQEEFRAPRSIEFSFADNQVSIDGATKFSESSTVVLRHLFHLALLSASTRIPEMRFPRLLVLDGIEDGGLEVERAHLLQEIIVEECEAFEADFQLIFASSQISPRLNRPDYLVGTPFTEHNRSLDFAKH